MRLRPNFFSKSARVHDRPFPKCLPAIATVWCLFQNVLRQLVETEEEHVVLSLFNIRVIHTHSALKMIMTNFGVELLKIARSGESAWQVFLFVYASLIQVTKQIKL